MFVAGHALVVGVEVRESVADKEAEKIEAVDDEAAFGGRSVNADEFVLGIVGAEHVEVGVEGLEVTLAGEEETSSFEDFTSEHEFGKLCWGVGVGVEE